VGATTIDEYRKHIEKDAALARRFQSVFVPEPTVEDTISILRGLKEKYELHHGVDITDGAIVAAANLSERYIADRFLPDKAIDLIDEAASRKRMEMDSKPEEIDELDRRVIQLKIERGVLIKENDSASKDRLTELELGLTASEGRVKSLSAKWQSEKESLHDAQNLKEQLDTVRNELEAEKRNGNYERAGELVHSVIPDLESQLYVFAEAHGEDGALMVSEKVVDDDIASVVSRSTGIPVDKIVEGEGDKLLQMETALAKRVVGQKDAVLAVSNAVRRARAGLQDPTRPIGSFMFLGPTGVGKTELCKALAEFLFDDEGAMLRIDMSEYMERHAVARLIGAPPGYVGYEEGGTLTETIRRRPYQLVLFDEVEKAHEDVFNVLLQLLDDGRLTDGQGRTANFTNTLVVMTSNLGSEILAQQGENKEFETSRVAVMEMVRRSFRPEFLNRIDEMIVFKKLDRDQMTSIVRIQLDRLQMLLSTRRINIDVTGSAIKWLAEVGYDPVYGARPLKRVIQRRLQDPLARYLLEGTVKDGDQVAVAADDDGLRFDVAHLIAA
jgi:ATP-dependent Clp protease ATP-binding subunit ClpB